MSKTDTTKKLRAEILAQLKKVNADNAPMIHEAIATEQGYVAIEKRIIDMVLNEGLTPSACIPHIEGSLTLS